MKTPVEPTPLVSDERKPLSYYMNNALWYFGQPPDPISGQVVPRSTVESWMERTKEMEVNLAKLIAERDELVEALDKMMKTAIAKVPNVAIDIPEDVDLYTAYHEARTLLSKYK